MRTFVVCLVSLFSLPTFAAEDDIVRIEEFWELVVGDPDPDSTAPQITSSFSPIRHDDILHATFSLNHRQVGDEFGAGGLQLQLWHGEQLIGQKTAHSTAVLAKPGEVIRWTGVLSVNNGILKFSIENGTSVTWGNFGSKLSMSLKAGLENLNGYRPNTSIDNSGTVYAANRVDSLRMTKVRAHRRSGKITTLTSAAITPSE